MPTTKPKLPQNHSSWRTNSTIRWFVATQAFEFATADNKNIYDRSIARRAPPDHDSINSNQPLQSSIACCYPFTCFWLVVGFRIGGVLRLESQTERRQRRQQQGFSFSHADNCLWIESWDWRRWNLSKWKFHFAEGKIQDSKNVDDCTKYGWTPTWMTYCRYKATLFQSARVSTS